MRLNGYNNSAGEAKTITLDPASGSAEFAGNIEQGNFDTSSSAAFGIKNNISSAVKSGTVNVQHAWDASTTANAFAVYKAASDGGTVDSTVQIKGNGDACCRFNTERTWCQYPIIIRCCNW